MKIDTPNNYKIKLTKTLNKRHSVMPYLGRIYLKKKNRFINTMKMVLFKEELLIISWWDGAGGKNWGDALNPILIKHLSGKKPVISDEIINFKNEPTYSVIGSILETYSKQNLIVWGSGFISSRGSLKEKPLKVCAVRGPLTRELIVKQGIDCPEIYGDPALLYPLFYRPTLKKKYRLGIIPHYLDMNYHLVDIFKEHSDILIIDILSGINEVVDSICSCERIASSSLHGIIAADAYGIPSIWIIFSNEIGGDGFKFFDYFESVGRKNERPLIITENTTPNDIYNQFHEYELKIDLLKLLESCPFMKEDQKLELNKNIINN